MSAQRVDPSAGAAPLRRYVSMRSNDVAQVSEMERRNYDFPWSTGIFKDCIKAGYDCQLMLLDEELIGYGVLQSAAGEAHILNLCIDARWQRQGHARHLLGHLVQLSLNALADIVFLEVRPSNPRAISLYEQNGFNEIGLRRDYYDSATGREDAVVMARSLKGYTGDL